MKLTLKLSLRQKVLILVALPLLVQLALIIGLSKVQNDAEKQLAEADNARAISDAVNHLSNDIYELIGTYGDERSVISFSPTDPQYLDYRARFDKDFAELRTLSAKKPDILASVDNASKAIDQAVADLVEIKNSLILYGSHFRADRRPLWVKLRQDTMRAIDTELFSVGERERRLANQSTAIQAGLRMGQQRIMIASAIASVLLAVGIAIVLMRSITERLAQMIENTYRLASGAPLLPVQAGADEISKLDRTFHSMAAALEGAARKESAFIESANDVLCMLTPTFKITSINPACEKQFGFNRNDLLGTHVTDMVVGTDQDRARAYLNGLRQGEQPLSVEVRMRLLNGSIGDMVWSGRWSKEEDSFFCIIHDITQIKEAERTKQEIMAMMTHDLKTPLTNIKNAIEILPTAEPEKRRRYFEIANRNVDLMKNLVSDMLDLEKARAGMLKLAKEKIDITECIDQALDATAGMAEAARVKVVSQAPGLPIEADPDALARVITNLVSNAIKFSPAGGDVIIGARKDGTKIEVSVQDQGAGIAAADVDRIFDRFHQASEGGANRRGGTGLGLTICREFVRLHGGKIWVESRTGHGSKFIFTLPA